MSDYDTGLQIRREIHGDAYVNRALDRRDEFTAPFQDFITRHAWGDVWARPGLDRRTRLLVTVALLCALRSHNELALYIRAALRNDVTPEELREVLLHTAVYAGVPAANTAFSLAQTILAEERPER